MDPVWIIGSGPAGLMAAEQVARAGCPTVVVDHKPSFGRKFLMAGKSGLNLTMDAGQDDFLSSYNEGRGELSRAIKSFGPDDVRRWAHDLGCETFTGSSGRVFPVAMKASPLLRAWLHRLSRLNVEFKTRWRWAGWQGDKLRFHTPDGVREYGASAYVLALGGGSWSRLGSDGHWVEMLREKGVAVTPLQPSNSALRVNWSPAMERFWGVPVKNISLSAGGFVSRGEVVVSARGIEGSGAYALTPAIRAGRDLTVDLAPDMDHHKIVERLNKARAKDSLSTRLRKALRLSDVKIGLLREFARPLPSGAEELAHLVKCLELRGVALAPIDEAISTSGGVSWEAVNPDLMLTACEGGFVAGEMLDWDAPTGGYLITACLATGRLAGAAAAQWAQGVRAEPADL